MTRNTMLDGPTRGTFLLTPADNAPTPVVSQTRDTKSEDQEIEAQSDTGMPKDGTNYIIKSVATGELITILDGEVILSGSNTPGSIEWMCVEKQGVYGFKNRATGTFLGHNGFRQLRSWAPWHRGWENFKVWPRPGGFLLTMDFWWSDLPIGVKMVKDTRKLGMLDFEDPSQVLWEFVRV